MKEQKGILGKLLSITGVILVTLGVFVFQNFSHAEDTAENTGGSGSVGVTIVDATDATDEEEDCVPVVCDEEDTECEPVECEEDCEPVVCDADDSECVPVECEDEGTGDDEGGESGNGGDEGGEEQPKVLEIFTLRYNANGGPGAPSAQVCKSSDGVCGFEVAASVPGRD
ncbi:hypothetical protein IJG95_01880, partial [Candidatus Saccharibacteria bacterium]|nr:hypothetical protein [Candidatus Saccharibacteria bacterium]